MTASRAFRALSCFGSALPAALPLLAAAALASPLAAQDKGVWGPVTPWPHVAVHLLHQPDGEILTWAYDGLSARLWDPRVNTFVPVPNTVQNIFCSGHAALAKGQFVVAGGISNNSTQIFEYATDTWRTAADMAYDRFYPTCTTLPDGRIVTTSGAGGAGISIPEVYDPAHDTWTELTNANLTLPLYPFNFLLPDKTVFFSGPGLNSYVLDVANETWTFVDSSTNDGASAVMLEPGLVMKCGGFSSATRTTEVIDLRVLAPQWRVVGPMAFERHDHNLTLLPDGKVLATGGHDSNHVSVLEAELFDPRTNTWKTLAPMQTPRRYHSTAQLLQDARVVSAGGDGFPSAEIFEPPYLFQGPRPKIVAGPDAVGYGKELELKVSSANKIEKVTLLRLGGVTHSFDHNQRYVELKFEASWPALTDLAGNFKLLAKGPATAAIAPPGAYLLFLVSIKGVPSVGHYILVTG